MPVPQSYNIDFIHEKITLDDIFKLPDITRPIIIKELIHCRSGDTGTMAAMDVDEMIDEKRGCYLFAPLVYTDADVKVGGLTVTNDDRFGVGDIFIDPLILCWYETRWDAFFASGAYMPTGEYDEDASPGKGYWTFMHQAGLTYYFDQSKLWTLWPFGGQIMKRSKRLFFNPFPIQNIIREGIAKIPFVVQIR